MEKFGGAFDDFSLTDILGFENESDLFNKQAKVSKQASRHVQSILSRLHSGSTSILVD